jgi:S1-C subfamily serine protease
VITAAEGQQLTDESSLARVLSQHQPGDTVTLTIVRAGQSPQDVKVTLGQQPGS